MSGQLPPGLAGAQSPSNGGSSGSSLLTIVKVVLGQRRQKEADLGFDDGEERGA